MKRILLLILMVFTLSGLKAQDTLTIGTGTSKHSNMIIPGYFGFHTGAYLFTSDEMLNQACVINSLALDMESVASGTNRSLKIYLKEVVEQTLPTSLIFNDLLDGATLVYDQSSVNVTAHSWSELIFDSPFIYSGTSSLLVIYEGVGCSSGGGCSASIYYDPSIINKAWNIGSDYIQINYTIPQSLNTDYRPNVKFIYTPLSGDYCMPVSELFASNLQMNSADVSWSGTETQYAYELKLASESWTSDNVETGVTSSTSITFTDLEPATNYNCRVKAICSEGNESSWMTISFRTICQDLITELPYIEYFQNGLDCWEIMRESQNSIGDPVGPMIEVVSGQNVAKFGENMSMMAIPAPFTEHINNLRVYLEMRSLAYYGTDHLTVGLVTDLADTTSFIPVQTFSANVNGGWLSRTVSFANVDINDEFTYYIAVKVQGSSTTYFYIRRFQVELIPSCPAPNRTSVTAAPAAETATISWTDPDATHQAWNVYYREKPLNEASAEDWLIQPAESSMVLLENLTAQTTYQAFVVTDCGIEDVSDRTDTIEFTTTATAVELPYIQDFEDATNLDGITLTQVTGSNSWHIGSATSCSASEEISGSSLYISYDNGVSNTYTNSPSTAIASIIVDFSEQAEYIMEFDLKVKGEAGYNVYDYFRVYALDASQPVSNYANGTALCSQKANILNWEHQTIIFPSEFIGTVKNVILVWYNDSSNQYDPPAAVDNIHIRATNCYPPSNLIVVSTGQTNATLSWTGSAESYNVVYYAASNPSEVFTEPVTDTILELTDLEGTTEYVVKVYSVCGEEISTPTSEVHFSTDCAPITDDVWFENFDSAQGSQSAANQIFRCFDVLYSTQQNNGAFPRIYHEGYVPSAHSGAVTIEFKGRGLLALPEFERPLNTLRFEFYANTTASTEAAAGTMEVGVLTDVNDSTSFVPLQTITPVGLSRNGSHLVGPFDFNELSYTEGRIALRYTPATSNSTESWNLDDFRVIPIPACPSPIENSVVVSNITDTEATISWIDPNEDHSAWIVYYKSSADEEYTAIPVEEQNFTLTGLDPLTTYSVYIQTDCGTEDNVSRTDIVSFTTIATPITDFPYYQTFEELEDNPSPFEYRNQYTNKWYIGTATGVASDEEETTTALYISDDEGNYNYNISAASYASAILPVTFGEASQYILSFDYKVVGEATAYSQYDYFMLFLCNSDVNIPSNGQPSSNGSTVLMDKTCNVSNWTHTSINLPNVSNTTKQIVFYWRNDGTSGTNPPIAIDNISIIGVDCQSPSNLIVEETTADEVTLSWQENASATVWTIFYKAENETEYSTLTTGINPAIISGLEPSTTYTAYVVSDCNGEFSGATNTVTFTTQCSTISDFPYYQGFETNPAECWNAQLISGQANWEIRPTLSYNSAYEGTHLMGIDYTTGSARLTTPVFDLTSLNNPSVKFAYVNDEYAGIADEIRLQYKSTPEAEWTDIMIMDTPHSSWVLDSVSLPEPSDSYQLSFLLVGHFGDGAAIDAFQVYDCEGCTSAPQPQPCDAPTDVTAINVTATTAQITWNGSADSYEVRLNALVTETVSGTIHQYTGLIPNTLYIVEVRSVCGASTSDWTEIYFSTLEEQVLPCDAPTNLSVSNITENSADITWNGNADAYEFRLNNAPVETLTATTKALTGLTPSTAYTVEVRSVCGEQTSEWTSTTFTTLANSVVEEGEVITQSATEVGNTSATLNGALVSTGNSENFIVGFALSSNSSDFTLEDAGVQNITAALTEANTFSQSVNNLLEGQVYFFRAYITNEVYTTYGEVKDFTLSGLNDAIANQINVTVYPNPATSQATLQVKGLQSDAKIVISDLQGRILCEGKIKANTTAYTLDLSNMSSGVYYIRIVTDNVISTQKLIVE